MASEIYYVRARGRLPARFRAICGSCGDFAPAADRPGENANVARQAGWTVASDGFAICKTCRRA